MTKRLVAVSGGSDSMALMDWMNRKGFDFVACHVNYKHRPTADRDEKIVRDWCKSNGKQVEVLYPVYKKGNFEAWAREVRYNFFEEMARKYSAIELFVGHHQGDLIETWMLQKKRGSIPETYGLKERTMRNGLAVVRPFLGYTKKELEDYCQRYNINWGLDETNLSDDYARNRIRHELIDPSTAKQRAEWIEQVKKDNAELEEKRKTVARLIEDKSATKLLAHELAWLALDELEYRRTGHHSTRASMEDRRVKLLQSGKAQGIHVVDDWFVYETGEVIFEEYATMDELKRSKFLSNDGELIQAFFVKDEDFPVVIRSPRQSDVVGMRYGQKKVMKLLRDKKVPAVNRYKSVVVESREGIIFVKGSGCSKENYQNGTKLFVR